MVGREVETRWEFSEAHGRVPFEQLSGEGLLRVPARGSRHDEIVVVMRIGLDLASGRGTGRHVRPMPDKEEEVASVADDLAGAIKLRGKVALEVARQFLHVLPDEVVFKRAFLVELPELPPGFGLDLENGRGRLPHLCRA